RHPTPPEEIERRRELARRSSWDERAARMEEELVRLFPPVTVGIVTFNNRELTELCLESVRRATVYPNYEIVVVDNGSSDRTPEWLEELAGRWPRLRVIANETNRGFAAACNQAFEAGSGQILCFLNNDTVVTRGWLTSMVRHLVEHPETGMVGPVSNGVANAARVEPGYRDLAGLDEWAASWRREHRGDSFPIPMLALYCAALRREVWEEVGPLDESFGTGMFEDDDYSKRLRKAGYELRCLREAYVHHWQQASFGKLPGEEYARLFEENRRKYREKWRQKAGAAEPAAGEAAAAEGVAAAKEPPAPRELPVYDSAESSGAISAMIADLLQYTDLLRLLVGTNLKTRYKRSLLGVAWTLLNPLATMVVMTIAFSALFRFSLPDYPVYVLAGLTFWTFFQQSTTQAMSSLVWGSGLLKKVHIPAAVFPLSAVGTGVVNMALSFVPILLIMVVLHHPFTWALLFVPVAMVLISIFALGISLILSSLAIFFSDVVEMYGVFLRIWFYLTPVMYPEKIVPERFLWMIKINPLYHFMLCWRAPIYNGTLPPMHSVAVCVLWAAGMLLAGAWVFSRQEHQFALRA
ncbi:MAG TPA: glycosyltransferase, partial [Acidobacteria bacterium]|nr:glycosyltransferase [Acidobacteriota bacterium]